MLKPPNSSPIVRPGRPKIDGYVTGVLFPPNLRSRIEEYRTFVKNKTGFYPQFNPAVRTLIDLGLKQLGITDESEDDEEDSQ